MRNLVQRHSQLFNQFVADGVALVRTIQRNSGDASVVRETECFIVHAIRPSFNPPPLNLRTALQSRQLPAAAHRTASAKATSRRTPPMSQPPAPLQYCQPKHPARK